MASLQRKSKQVSNTLSAENYGKECHNYNVKTSKWCQDNPKDLRDQGDLDSGEAQHHKTDNPLISDLGEKQSFLCLINRPSDLLPFSSHTSTVAATA